MSDHTNVYLSVASVSPRVGWDPNVTLTPTIAVRFNVPVNTALVTTDVALNQYVVLLRSDTDETFNVTYVDWDSPNRLLTFQPDTALTSDTTYRVLLRKELQTAQGRRMLEDYTWSFRTSAAPIARVSLTSPGDATAFSSAPTLEWTGVWFASGSITYDVQLDTDWHFGAPHTWTTAVTTSTTGGTLSIAIATALTGNQAYFWRVRGRTATLTGDWSDSRSFYLGRSDQAAPDSTFLYNPELGFQLVTVEPEDQAETHLAAWPTLRATFSQSLASGSVTSGNCYLESLPVDGRAGGRPTRVTVTTEIAGTQLTVMPDGEPATNTLYRWVLGTTLASTGGVLFGTRETTRFTGPYSPLYGGLLAVRNDLGEFLAELPDDQINYQLWRQSLRINEILLTRRRRNQPEATLAGLVDYTASVLQTYGLYRIAELGAAIQLLERYYGDQLKRAGRRGTLATFEFEVKVDLLEELRDRIDQLKKALLAEEARFLLEVRTPRVTRKSQLFEAGGPRERDDSWPGRSRF